MRHFFQNFEAYICAFLFLLMTLLGFVNVLIRYLTDYSFASTQELLLQGFLLLTIFGGALAARRGEHIAVTFFTDLLGQKMQFPIRLFADLVSVTLLVIAAYYCYEMVVGQKQTGVVSSGLQIPLWYYSSALPLGFALIILRLIQRNIEVFRNKGNIDTEQPHA